MNDYMLFACGGTDVPKTWDRILSIQMLGGICSLMPKKDRLFNGFLFEFLGTSIALDRLFILWIRLIVEMVWFDKLK